MEKSADSSKAKRDGLIAGLKMLTTQQAAAQELATAKTDEERKEKQTAMEQAQVFGMLNIMWTTTVVDITTTLHAVIQMVVHDQSVDKDIRTKRANGLIQIGEIFMACPTPAAWSNQPEDAKAMYEKAAFAAMLETIKRKEEAAHSASAKN